MSVERKFEPFFTTKAQGMGMGLAIFRSIIESHGGRLWAENSKPRGARFFLTLPVDAKAVQMSLTHTNPSFDLGISEVTVKLHRSNAMRKMGTTSIGDLVRTWETLPSDIRDA